MPQEPRLSTLRTPVGPGEASDFYVELKQASPGDRVAFLVRPPNFLSLTWPTEVMAREKEPQQWAETVRHFVTAVRRVVLCD